MKTVLSGALSLGLALLAQPSSALACDCIHAPTVAKAFAEAEVVATVRVRSITADKSAVSLDVMKSWKGARAGEVLEASGPGSTCDYYGLAEVGTAHLLYLTREGGQLRSRDRGGCGRSSALAEAGADTAQLDRLATPSSITAPTAASSTFAPEATTATTVTPDGNWSGCSNHGCAQARSTPWAPWLLLPLALFLGRRQRPRA